LSNQTNENNDNGILSGIWRAFAERRKNNVLYQKFLHKLARPKAKVLVPIDKEKKHHAVATFNVKYDGTLELEEVRAVSQAEAKKITDDARQRGWELDGNEKLTRYGQELSAKDAEWINSAKKQLKEKYGHLLEENKDGQSVLKDKEFSIQKPELPKTAITQKADDTLKKSHYSVISDSLKRINEKVSALNTGKNVKSQQYQKPVKFVK